MSGKAARSAAKIGPDTRRTGPVPPMRGGRSPATGMAAIAPAPAANSTSESDASDRSNSAFISGIATAQAPMAKPRAKKIAVTPMRARITCSRSVSTVVGALVIPRRTSRSLRLCWDRVHRLESGAARRRGDGPIPHSRARGDRPPGSTRACRRAR